MRKAFVLSAPDLFDRVNTQLHQMVIVRFDTNDIFWAALHLYDGTLMSLEQIYSGVENEYFSTPNEINMYPGLVPMEEDIWTLTYTVLDIIKRLHLEISPHFDYLQMVTDQIVVQGGRIVITYNA